MELPPWLGAPLREYCLHMSPVFIAYYLRPSGCRKKREGQTIKTETQVFIVKRHKTIGLRRGGPRGSGAGPLCPETGMHDGSCKR